MDRWTSFLDIEGFAHHYKADEMRAWHFLRGLMSDIHRLGSTVYPRAGKRIFAHQLVDGFVLVFHMNPSKVEEPLSAIAALMHSSLSRGCCLKCSLVKGHVCDVQGMYPEEVMSASDSSGTVRMGDGIMTISHVFGQGSIDAYKLGRRCSGPVFLVNGIDVDAAMKAGLHAATVSDIVSVDWVRPTGSRVGEILRAVNRWAEIDNAPSLLKKYLETNERLSEKRTASARNLLVKQSK